METEVRVEDQNSLKALDYENILAEAIPFFRITELPPGHEFSHRSPQSGVHVSGPWPSLITKHFTRLETIKFQYT